LSKIDDKIPLTQKHLLAANSPPGAIQSNKRPNAPLDPWLSMFMTGATVIKIPANNSAISLIGSKEKSFFSRIFDGVIISEIKETATSRKFLKMEEYEKLSSHKTNPPLKLQKITVSKTNAINPTFANPLILKIGLFISILRAGLKSILNNMESIMKNNAHKIRVALNKNECRCFMNQKKSIPFKNPMNNGGSPNGVAAPPTFATKNMKNTTKCTV
jgi:hypothetical protein